ncbi:MAG: SGNH/GDSL hydrolase family protein [Anaerolineae bacterium]|nr:SGNH/GDSL hydrolase family protein [Anaerolineae bacterium]
MIRRVLVATVIAGVTLLGSVQTGMIRAQEPPKYAQLPDPRPEDLNQSGLDAIDLSAVPLFTLDAAYVQAIWEEGVSRGNNPSVFSKIGDCMTATPDYMVPFSNGEYELGEYSSLQAVIDRYVGVPARTQEAGFDSFSNPGLAAASGFNAAGVLDSTWSDPKWCSAEESPLVCEFRASKPSIAFIMFGTNDLNSLTLAQFDYYLRLIVVRTINNATIPVLTTFPNQPGREEQSIQFNKMVVKVAQDYNVPLLNLWAALEPIPNQGINPDEPTHMTKPESGKVASFLPEDLTAGYNLHNLLTLQMLEQLLKVVDPAAVG